MTSKNTICLWYDGAALDAAQFYAATFADSAVGAVHRAPGDYPSGTEGDVMMVDFTVMGVPCLGLNGGPMFKHSEAFSFQVATDDQAETDRLWNAIVDHDTGQEQGKAARHRAAEIIGKVVGQEREGQDHHCRRDQHVDGGQQFGPAKA